MTEVLPNCHLEPLLRSKVATPALLKFTAQQSVCFENKNLSSTYILCKTALLKRTFVGMHKPMYMYVCVFKRVEYM
jgi:hypothetical protein